MSLFTPSIVFGGVLPSIRWLAAVVLLSFIALAAIGSSARINGEVNAALQTPGTRTIAIALLATPIVLAFRTRSSALPGNA